MLGWMLKRGENASNAVNDAEQPDTPAPVFAARAFKSALFGTPRRHDIRAARPGRRGTTTSNTDKDSNTPSKPAGILLTPGTGAARRKRVSFGYDVSSDKEPVAEAANAINKQESSATSSKNNAPTAVNSRLPDDEDDWEEDDDGEQPATDMTLDLNEPHSQSGKYWKEEFEKYHEDAKVELEKLLKYKQLAKSYAKQRDAETMQLAERLRDEQLKVLKMEKMIAENERNIASARQAEDGDATVELLDKLTSQTTLATQYREQVQKLEAELEEALRDREQRADVQRRRRQGSASPATHKALAETQRELRQAKSQLREMGTLRDQVSSLKAKLQAAQGKPGSANDAPGESSRTQELRAQLRVLKEESLMKDQELLILRSEFDAFREESARQDADMRDVVTRAHSKIADLKMEIKALKSTQAEKPRPQSWDMVGNTDAAGLEDLDDPVVSAEPARCSLDTDRRRKPHAPTRERKSRSLREKFREDAPPSPERLPCVSRRQADDRRQWQEFVPRSPRNLDYLGEDVARRIENGGVTPAAQKKKAILSAHEQMERRRRPSQSDGEDAIDLLRSRFAKLGGPEEGGQGHGGISIPSGINLPPERRAAALARIEKRMAEKKRARARTMDKENMQPVQ
ncbi:Spindle-body formation-associated protein [Cordyceps fumosorosea ARSEF 2679]|uniref:Spindle-body formation-associated protein n=1 Tax=Cordyceps fumosorosea (strain ARSEF 2679) TaxID=1081104 RepID=A0A168DEU2_CORFA|nr:Spindle-body formation-associated protein [Cordyceps fumosorosea ARSEF 2679]OAA72523.1 Spindle-body formation-associated protein [Cordyceps fumosorosea ARSEF 2679]